MNRLAVGRSARAQQAHKVNNRINQLIPVGTGPLKSRVLFRSRQTDTHRRRVILGLPRASSGRQLGDCVATQSSIVCTPVTLIFSCSCCCCCFCCCWSPHPNALCSLRCCATANSTRLIIIKIKQALPAKMISGCLLLSANHVHALYTKWMEASSLLCNTDK